MDGGIHPRRRHPTAAPSRLPPPSRRHVAGQISATSPHRPILAVPSHLNPSAARSSPLPRGVILAARAPFFLLGPPLVALPSLTAPGPSCRELLTRMPVSFLAPHPPPQPPPLSPATPPLLRVCHPISTLRASVFALRTPLPPTFPSSVLTLCSQLPPTSGEQFALARSSAPYKIPPQLCLLPHHLPSRAPKRPANSNELPSSLWSPPSLADAAFVFAASPSTSTTPWPSSFTAGTLSLPTPERCRRLFSPLPISSHPR